jgi:hypothetical protein
MTDKLIAFPLAVSAINGWPNPIRLTAAEARATARAFLGGLEALRTPDYRVACRTVDALIRKGLLGRDGLTLLGRAVGEALAHP